MGKKKVMAANLGPYFNSSHEICAASVRRLNDNVE